MKIRIIPLLDAWKTHPIVWVKSSENTGSLRRSIEGPTSKRPVYFGKPNLCSALLFYPIYFCILMSECMFRSLFCLFPHLYFPSIFCGWTGHNHRCSVRPRDLMNSYVKSSFIEHYVKWNEWLWLLLMMLLLVQTYMDSVGIERPLKSSNRCDRALLMRTFR